VSIYPSFYELTYEGIDFLVDSLVIGENIELIGSVASTNPLCAGAVFLLQPGYDLGTPQPVTSVIGGLLLDGDRPFGYQAGNRTITLPIEISVPGDPGTPAAFSVLAAAREVLLREVNQQTWTLRWTRDPGTGTALPLLFDCFRAHATVVEWGGVSGDNRFPIGILHLTFEALPYGRSDVPVVTDFPSPLSGRSAPPAAITVDAFGSVSGAQWAASVQSPVPGGASAFWDPSITPASAPAGIGQAATYSKGSLALNLAAGYTVTGQGTAAANNYIICNLNDGAKPSVGDQGQLWNHAGGTLLQTQIFTVTNISAPFAGFVNVFFSPAAATATVLNNIFVQTGPPQLPALTFWAGLGSSLFYPQWARLGGRVVFAVTLTDTYSTALKFSKTVKVTGSGSSLAPRWNKIRIPVPYQPGFDYANVASYSVTVTNRATGDLRYTQLYLSDLEAVPAPRALQSPARGTVYELSGLPGTARAPVSLQFQQTGSKTYVQQFTVQGQSTWVCPPGVSTVAVFAIGAGGLGAAFGANGGGGGGGGGSAANAAVAVTPGKAYVYGVGQVSGVPGGNGGISFFTGDSVTVTANGGTGGSGSAGGAGGAAGTGGFAGGPGGAGVATTAGGGGGGGASGGTGALGGTGGAASGGTGGAGGTAVAGGGNGGRGGTKNVGNGAAPTTGYGGGSGGSPGGAFGSYSAARGGLVQLTYTASLPGFQTLIAHRPPPGAPDSLLPFVSPSPADPADGNTQYPVASLAPGVQARFGGTYTVVLSVWAWHTTNVSRTLTVTVTQWEQPGGASYTASTTPLAIRPDTLTACSGTNANFGPLLVLGELTLPVQDLPQDNANAYFTVSVTSTDTADQFQDVLFLDTQGSTVMILSPTAYANMFLDEPAADRDIGLVMGSLFDRADAVSILDRATVAGGPVSVDGDGNPHLLVYASEGAPNCQMTWYPRWWLDRLV
jgi:hypothetical protein